MVEYHPPDGEAEPDQKLTRYVEVEAGQKFQIRMAFLPGFQFRFAAFVYYKFQVDDDDSFLFKTVGYSACDVHGGTLVKAVEREWVSTPWKDESTGTWHDYEYEFGALGLGEQFSL